MGRIDIPDLKLIASEPWLAPAIVFRESEMALFFERMR